MLCALVVSFSLVAGTVPSQAAGVPDWTSYLRGPLHTSFNASATAITPGNAATLGPAWGRPVFAGKPTMPGQPGATWLASPTVFNHRIFIGSNTGVMYAYDLATGTKLWNTFLGFQPTITCPGQGIASTAAVADDPLTGKPAVYVAAGDGHLYALRASDGTVLWRSLIADPGSNENARYPWGSPTVVNGHIYIGISSNCDNPLIRGGLREFDQATGTRLHTYLSVPRGAVGGSVWSSAGATKDGRAVYVTTGNADPQGTEPGDSASIVRLNGNTLAKQDTWTVPTPELTIDSDFGASPTTFRATIDSVRTALVGACNKNGRFYALRADDLASGPVWSFQVSDPHLPGEGTGCIVAAIFDGARLYEAGPSTRIDAQVYSGAIRELDPATGTPIWETGLAENVLGTPTMDGAGVIAVASWDFNGANAVFLIDASNGAILDTLSYGTSMVFGQPVFAGKFLIVASRTKGMMAYTAA